MDILKNLQLLQIIIDALPNPIFYKDQHGLYQGCNKAFCDLIFGVPRENIIGKAVEDLNEFIPENLRTLYRRQDQELFDNPGTQTYEAEVKCADGQKRCFMFNKTILKDELGNAVGIFGLMTDLSDRIDLENTLKKKQSGLIEILQGISIATFVVNSHHIVTHWNQACERLTGISAEHIIGTGNHQKVFYQEERPLLADLIADSASENDIQHYYGEKVQLSHLIPGAYRGEAFFPSLGSDGKWLYFTAAPLLGEDGTIKGTIETFQDITERKKLEQESHQREHALAVKTKHLEDTNQVMKNLLDSREVEKNAIEQTMVKNLNTFILPYIEEMEKNINNSPLKVYLDIIKANLNDLIAPVASKLNVTYLALTPMEIRIADMVRQGRQTKEIAETLSLSPGSVSWHRNNIRKKLKLNRNTNLQTYLNSLSN